MEFPNFLGKGQKYPQTRNRKCKNISQESTNCLEMVSSCLELLQLSSKQQPLWLSAPCPGPEAVSILLGKCLGGTDLNKILGNILDIS